MTKDELQAKRAVALSELKDIEVALCLDEHYIDIIEKENAELKAENELIKNSDSLCKLIGEQKLQIEQMKEEHQQNELGLIISNSSARVELNEKIEQLEKENAKLKAVQRTALYSKLSEQLANAKEIIREYMRFETMIGTCSFYSEEYEKTKTKAEQFLKEIEK